MTVPQDSAALDRQVASNLRKQADTIDEVIGKFELRKPEHAVWHQWFIGEAFLLRDVAIGLDHRANDNDRLRALLVQCLPLCGENFDLARLIRMATKVTP